MTRHDSLDDFLATGARGLRGGPAAVLVNEDGIEIDSTIRHHLALGFRAVIAVSHPDLTEPHVDDPRLHVVAHRETGGRLAMSVVNRLMAALDGLWVYYGYNAEYLFYPFCETRNVGELLAFHTEERRDAMLAYVVDLYAGDLSACPDGVSLADAHLDLSGYYALGRAGPNGHPKERQLDFFGGLRWRFEEHFPADRRRIDRISLFRAQKGLELRGDHTFSDEEYNTYACPWHNNLTAAVCSFRTAKALKGNAGSTFDIGNFVWRNSGRFEWSSQQLMDLGLMEPGQWF
ncbi:MAG: hypothetical protein CVT80_02100 [Alphaproteobacteria bacterium HGW-Alphaproteobacteria-2]|nr:MAG: hypothetical protein CVT80_02100 [Alphaproteobacteria bacterium HGW-Alphaproteobacteria-2]